ncbi:MAG: tetratricopeptide repeat protein [Desulfobacterales bacterium]|nr:tetratricopeptide repeat protein [Desulfobacterales bacterium]
MTTNTILRFLLHVIAFVLAIPAMATNFFTGCLLAIPPIGLVYVSIMSLIWLPSLGFMRGSSWLWEKIPFLRLPLALIGVPIVVVIGAFLLLAPNPDETDKIAKFAMCDSWPLLRDTARQEPMTPDIARWRSRYRFTVESYSCDEVERGDSCVDVGQFEKAIDEYSKAIDKEPESAEAYVRRATAYAELGDFERALQDFKKAINTNPEEAYYHYNMSLAYDGLGDIDKSIEELDKAIELDETYAKAYYNRGLAYIEKGEHNKAILDFDKTMSVAPDSMADALFNRGRAYQAKGEHTKALKDYNKVLELVSDPEDIKEVKERISEVKRPLL